MKPQRRKRKHKWRFVLYLPEDFLPVWEQFVRMIHLDKRIQKDDPSLVKNPDQIVSLLLRNMIKGYVSKHKEEILQHVKEVNDNETHQATDTKEDASTN